MQQDPKLKRPVVYSCSGSTHAGQLANSIAVRLSGEGIAEMSCIAGVGGKVEPLLGAAASGRKIIAIDGCSLGCSKVCLLQNKLSPDIHIDLSDWGVDNKDHIAVSQRETDLLLQKVKDVIGVDRLEVKPGLADAIEVREISGKKQLKQFIDLPYRLYQGNPYYVPQLKRDVAATFDPAKNPALEFCEARYWMAYRKGVAVGRIAGIINHAYIRTWGKKMMRFGWMDMENDPAIAKALLAEVEKWAKEKGMEGVHGPLGFTNFDYAGFLTRGYDQKGTFATIYNYPYYITALEAAGYAGEVDWVEYKIRMPEKPTERLIKLAGIVEKRNNLKIVRALKTKALLKYGKDIFTLINEAYEGLFGFVPLNEKQIAYNTRKYLTFIRPEYVSIVLDKDDKLAAFGITMPSLSDALQKAGGQLYPTGFLHMLRAFGKNQFADLLLVAVRKDLQGKGLNAILMNELSISYINKGIRFAESNPELEENVKVQALWQYFDAEQHKRRRCYIKQL